MFYLFRQCRGRNCKCFECDAKDIGNTFGLKLFIFVATNIFNVFFTFGYDITLRWQQAKKKQASSGKGRGDSEDKEGKSRKRGPAVDKVFLEQLKRLVSIMIPGLWSVEAGLLSLHTLVLVARTFLSIYVAKLEGRMVRHIVGRDVSSFVWLLTTWFGIALPATFINSLIRFLVH